MRRLYIISALSILIFSCKRDPLNVQPVWDGTNVMEGEWTMKAYQGALVVAPMSGDLVMVAKSDTSGTAEFDMTIDGATHNVESSLYDIKHSEKMVYYSRLSGGNDATLVHGEKWAIDVLILHDDNKPDTLAIHSDVTHQSMLFSKP